MITNMEIKEKSFMKNYFNNLPNDIQVKIMIYHGKMQHQKPKYKAGDCVKYKPEYIKERLATQIQIHGPASMAQYGQMPYGKLIIWGSPRIGPNLTWLYDYEYGFGLTSEGSAYETDLIPY
tara:strand:- start:1850 stop:2212 length:363 start_codon:yes stop_codon:yes gene_type:complete